MRVGRFLAGSLANSLRNSSRSAVSSLWSLRDCSRVCLTRSMARATLVGLAAEGVDVAEHLRLHQIGIEDATQQHAKTKCREILRLVAYRNAGDDQTVFKDRDGQTNWVGGLSSRSQRRLSRTSPSILDVSTSRPPRSRHRET